MTQDEQEALSRNFAPNSIKVLPLKSGNWALFDYTHDLLAIVPLEQLAAEIFELAKLLSAVAPKPTAVSNPIDLEDLGL